MTLTARTYGIDFTDREGFGYVQRDAVSAAAAASAVRRDYPGAAIVHVEVVYSAPGA